MEVRGQNGGAMEKNLTSKQSSRSNSSRPPARTSSNQSDPIIQKYFSAPPVRNESIQSSRSTSPRPPTRKQLVSLVHLRRLHGSRRDDSGTAAKKTKTDTTFQDQAVPSTSNGRTSISSREASSLPDSTRGGPRGRGIARGRGSARRCDSTQRTGQNSPQRSPQNSRSSGRGNGRENGRGKGSGIGSGG